MTDSNLRVTFGENRGNWIRLRTLILLRWVAIVGQLSAIAVAQGYYDLQLELGLCYLAVGVSVIGNMIAMFVFPENKRLTETENFLMILFDLVQLSFLIYVTGGLHNPFALLLIGPVTISASVLNLRSALIVGAAAIALVSLMVELYIPLRTAEGEALEVPDIFVFGNWAAIVIATLFISVYSRRITTEMHSMSDALFATQMALEREQKLTDLGGVVAAAAHELGTPLATIKLTSSELYEELDDYPELKDDAALIREQADRCRDILRDMGRAGKNDTHLRLAPVSTVVSEAAEPHMHRGKVVHFEENPGFDGSLPQPTIFRKPEIIHGLRNLIQNAVDFARANVWIECLWTENVISVRIVDDGAGYPSQMIGRIGDPFVRQRKTDSNRAMRPEYEGMGLGLFIAKTLLERSGAELSFANGFDPFSDQQSTVERRGAIVDVVWPRDMVDAHSSEHRGPLPENELIKV